MPADMSRPQIATYSARRWTEEGQGVMPEDPVSFCQKEHWPTGAPIESRSLRVPEAAAAMQARGLLCSAESFPVIFEIADKTLRAFRRDKDIIILLRQGRGLMSAKKFWHACHGPLPSALNGIIISQTALTAKATRANQLGHSKVRTTMIGTRGTFGVCRPSSRGQLASSLSLEDPRTARGKACVIKQIPSLKSMRGEDREAPEPFANESGIEPRNVGSGARKLEHWLDRTFRRFALLPRQQEYTSSCNLFYQWA
ncbi:hypothetical protein DFH09DRAFT_1091127 [Mycena vulgaris]|nr:hypothetical protein DFH09DRAFT_1091127 [Mycena vulgaris]